MLGIKEASRRDAFEVPPEGMVGPDTRPRERSPHLGPRP